MALGIVASIASILKVTVGMALKDSRDITWDSVPLVIFGFIEEYLGIIAACIPCLKALLERQLRRLGFSLASYGKSQSRSTYGQNPTTRNTLKQSTTDGTQLEDIEDGVPSHGRWHEIGKEPHLGYDSEGYLISGSKYVQ